MTACQSNAHVNKKVLNSLNAFKDINSIDDLLIIKLRGLNVSEQKLPRGLEKYKILDGGLKLNSNIRISDYKIRPNQIRPFTGLDAFAKADSSFIFGSPKQYFKNVPTLTGHYPKSMATTGVITDPRYDERYRINKIARADHRYGAILVDVKNGTTYYQRTLNVQKNGKFIDLCMKYNGNKKPVKIRPKALVWEQHVGDTDIKAYKTAKSMLLVFNPEKLIIHDFLNAHSINHHEKDDLIALTKKYNSNRWNLENEIKICSKELKHLSELSPDTKIYILDSNHNDFLKRYLTEGRFVKDPANVYFASKLLTGAFEGKNPLEVAINEFIKIPDNVIFTKPGDSLKAGKTEVGQHGHEGINGGKGTNNTYAKVQPYSIKGHTHSANSIRDSYTIPSLTRLDLDYARSGYSTWSQGVGLVYDRQVQLIHFINGKFMSDKR